MNVAKFIPLTPVQSADPTVKEWIIYNYPLGITSAIRYLYTDRDGKHHIAVARAFCSYGDMWCRKVGRTKALKRLRRFVDGAYGTVLTHTNQRSGVNIITFASGTVDVLEADELETFTKVALPRIDRYVFDTGYTVVEHGSIVNWQNDPIMRDSVAASA